MAYILFLLFVVFFFFSSRRRHTRSLCDWSSDVCSSDLQSAYTDIDLPLFPVLISLTVMACVAVVFFFPLSLPVNWSRVFKATTSSRCFRERFHIATSTLICSQSSFVVCVSFAMSSPDASFSGSGLLKSSSN